MPPPPPPLPPFPAALPQFTRRFCMPMPVAAGTSVATVVAVAAAAVSSQIVTAGDTLGAVPWNLVVYTVPGVVIGGQIAPRLQGKVPQRTTELVFATLFGSIGVLFLAEGRML